MNERIRASLCIILVHGHNAALLLSTKMRWTWQHRSYNAQRANPLFFPYYHFSGRWLKGFWLRIVRQQRAGSSQPDIGLPLRRPALEFTLSLVDLFDKTTGLFHDSSPTRFYTCGMRRFNAKIRRGISFDTIAVSISRYVF